MIAWSSAFFVLLMAVYPGSALSSSVRGLAIWWEVLFPSLFPFFVISELMLGFGVVHFMGKLLDPLMRPLFRLPGIGGFVVAMGYVSGYPVGARLTAQLWEQRLINRSEGERLVAFTTSSDPIFLIGAVSVGFFQNAAVAPVLAAAHYGGALLIGFLMRFHDAGQMSDESASASGRLPASAGNRTAQRRASPRPFREVPARRRSRIREAFRAMHEARLLDGRNMGELLRDAVQSGLRLMIVVGGLVVFFSVIMEVLRQTGFVGAIAGAVRYLLKLISLPQALTDPIVNGLFEVTLGSKSAGEADTGLMHRTAAAAWVLSWAGLSVHAQIASLLSRTDLRYKPFLTARLIHGLIASALVYLLWRWLGP
ncbi:sporulation integral membrane protein YlbJ [Paenibacillus beijingensis]|uniref:Membrane protein n=1 Tax=Paenibacillus beijingensis TaxID=1126833 RepID=A0A0D5NQJ8_9BACL|nr:sporulation integral membrane protein YlbJ [Paenibacillus beijingensis]AJY77455.1 membrane protein [Paenibacillus beijingensis]